MKCWRMDHHFEDIKPELEVQEYASLHKRGFKIQRIGLIAILAIVVFAALGLFGDGILSERFYTSKSGTVEFERYYRFEAPMEVRIELLGSNNSNVVSLSKEYLKNFEIKSITPVPESTNFKGNTSQFEFNGPGNGMVTFFLIPKKVGNITGDLSINGDRFKLEHFIYP